MTFSLYHGSIPIGFQLTDDMGDIFLYEFWTQRRAGHFVNLEIPDGQQIIGIECNTGDEKQTFIDRIGLQLCKSYGDPLSLPRLSINSRMKKGSSDPFSAIGKRQTDSNSESSIDDNTLPLSTTMPLPVAPKQRNLTMMPRLPERKEDSY